MAIRRPLVVVDGVIRQLPAADQLPSSLPPSLIFSVFGNDLQPGRPVLIKTGPEAVSVRAGTYVGVAGQMVRFDADTPVQMPALVAGEDYSVWVHPDGAASAAADPFFAPASPPVTGARRIGGFHRGLVAPGTTVAEGGFATSGSGMIWTQSDVSSLAGINAWSLWDLYHRPLCDPRGMTCVMTGAWQALLWADIYFCPQDHLTYGTSRSGVTVASGTVPPRKPLIFGGDGSSSYASLTWYDASEIAASHGKRLAVYPEFSAVAFGTTEGQSIGGASSITGRTSGYTSKWGVEQASGHHWTWGGTAHGVAGGSWNTGPGRGSSFGTSYAGYFGGSHAETSHSGSRCASWSRPPWDSLWVIGLRAVCDPAPRMI